MNPKSRVKQATILASVGAQAIAAFSLSAQDTVTVAGDDLICIDCVITLDTVVTIGGLDGPGLDAIQQSSKVAVDRRGRILVYWSRVPRISVFDSTGVFLRTIGGPGEGPGEYALVVHVDAGPRYIHVFDMRRRTLLDYEFVPVRADELPAQVSYSYVTESDDIVFSADLRTRDAVGHPLHMLTPSGELSSHGGHGRVYRGPSSDGLQSLSGTDGRLWVAPVYPNRLVEWDWDVAGEPTMRRVIDRAVEEFDRHDPERWPGPRNAGTMLDQHGLWIVWRAPDPDWDPDKFQNPTGEPRETVVDSWVDLVDPSSGRTIARRGIEGGYLKGFSSGSRYVVAYEESEAGVPYLHLTRLVLSRAVR